MKPLEFGIILTILVVVFFQEEPTVGGDSSIIFEKLFWKFRPVDIMILVILWALLLRDTFARKSIKLPNTVLNKPILGLILAILQGTIVGIIKRETSTRTGIAVLAIDEWKNLFVGISFFFIFTRVISNKQKLIRIAWSFIVMATGMAGYRLILYIMGHGLKGTARGYIIVQEGGYIYMLCLALLLTCSLVFFRPKKRMERFYLYIAIILFSMVLFLSFRRNGWLMVIIGLAIIFHFLPLRKKVRYGILLLLLLPSAKLFMTVPANINQYFTENIFSVGVHICDLEDAWEAVKEDPILGYGLGRVYKRRLSYMPWLHTNLAEQAYFVHNAFLHTWLKFGILGLICYIWLFYTFFQYGFKNIKLISNNYHRSIAVGFFAFVVGKVIGASWFGPPEYIFFKKSILIFFSMAIVLSIIKSYKKNIHG